MSNESFTMNEQSQDRPLKSAAELAMERTEVASQEYNSTKLTAEAVEQAKSFEELADAISASEGVQGSSEHFSPQDLVDRINEVLAGGDINLITRSSGLRQKVHDLMEMERIQSELAKAAEAAPAQIVTIDDNIDDADAVSAIPLATPPPLPQQPAPAKARSSWWTLGLFGGK